MYKGQRVGAVIVAAGSSRRMGGLDKIWAALGGRPLLAWVLAVFQESPLIDETVVVLNKGNIDVCRKRIKEQENGLLKVCAGGARRQDSVAAGLGELKNVKWVVVHDGARPVIDGTLIERGLDAAQETGSAVAAVPVKDTIKEITDDNTVKSTPARSRLWAVQTPQVFRYDLIKQAHSRITGDVTDDASLLEQLGYSVKIFMGSYDNIKVTTPDDLVLAECFLKKRITGL
jgi:2-C-methyl-D-erythritol 4-phosphate cytidylyltransferase